MQKLTCLKYIFFILQARIDALEQDLKRRDEDLKRQKMRCDDLTNRKDQLEEEISEKKALVEKREDSVKKIAIELNKVNDAFILCKSLFLR